MAESNGCKLLPTRCCSPSIDSQRYDDDDYPTASSEEQKKVEDSVDAFFKTSQAAVRLEEGCPRLQRERHVAYLMKGLSHLPKAYQDLDASRPWLCYWILHSLELLEITLYSEMKTSIADFLGKCQHPEGGFSGGPGQQAHLAPTYAAVNALSILGTEEAYKVINRKTLYSFLRRMKQPDGSFIMHEGGEADVRGAYCALSVAKLTNTFTPSLFEGTAEWVIKCQTYEGGFGGVPGMEAHGGYTFCGFAALVFLEREMLCNLKKLLRWLVNRQMRFEGGFQGRTNKLVDGCYSFWQGGAFPLLHKVLFSLGNESLSMEGWLFDQDALQEYILLCCQDPSGGLIDKPGKHRDYYHTCYLLSGLSVAQHFGGGILSSSRVLGDPANELITVHPLYNVGTENAAAALKYFNSQPLPEDGENS
ncbi:protein farnesyltransferase subunit beta [Rhipicephalus sanguineus]|uniref:protein farnesyltransferase subunit beta n=1 Tax=Rhipicephalus sanguineus TaxID=34632 RepID=UPI00189486A1|nr:protein farnesyltransferase subunit beta [Rhipicephalus sanguineus]